MTHSDTCYINGCRRTAAAAQHLPRHGASWGGASSIAAPRAPSRSPQWGRDRCQGSARRPEGLLHGVGSSAFLGPGMAGVPAQPPHLVIIIIIIGGPLPMPLQGGPGGGGAAAGQGTVAPASSPAPATRAGQRGQHPRRYRAQPVLSFSSCFFFLLLVSFLCFVFLLREERLPVLLPPPPAAPCPSCPRAGAAGKGAACRPGALRRRSLLLWPGPSALCLCPAGRLSCWPARARPRSARGRRAGARCRRSGWSS